MSQRFWQTEAFWDLMDRGAILLFSAALIVAGAVHFVRWLLG